MKKLILMVMCILVSVASFADNGYKISPSGVRYKIYSTHPGQKIVANNVVRLNFTIRTQHDSIIFSSGMTGQPADWRIDPPKFKGDLMDGLTMLAEGDSAGFIMPIDSQYKGMQLPPFLKHGEDIKIDVKIIKIYTMDQYKAMMQEMAAKQAGTDDSLIRDYIKKNNLTNVQKTQDGLYYMITEQGKGARPAPGQMVNVNYTGKLLNGTIFDSSLKPGRTPLQFAVGTGNVIKGWDEGVSLLNAGSKATFLIPSGLAYGTQGRGGVIPANAVLVFEVELISLSKPQAEIDDSLIQDYFKKNQINNAQKTADGLYYVVTKEGTGAKPAKGQTVTVNYTGKLLNGKVFDSSLNPGRQPFSTQIPGGVIGGWNEGIPLFNVGSKGTLYIPSALGYGPQGTSGIPGNSVLIFDIELLDAK